MADSQKIKEIEAASLRLNAAVVLSRLSRDHIAHTQNISTSSLYAWTNPGNIRFPNVFQLVDLCRVLNTDCNFIIDGTYESSLDRFFARHDPHATSVAKAAIAEVVNLALRLEGPPPTEHQIPTDLTRTQLTTESKLKLDAAIRESGLSRQEICSQVGRGLKPRWIQRWVSQANDSFPDCFTLAALCRVLDKKISQIAGDIPSKQSVETFLSNCSSVELKLLKEYSACILRSVYRL